MRTMYLAECSVFSRNTYNATREKHGQCSHKVYLWLPGLASHMHSLNKDNYCIAKMLCMTCDMLEFSLKVTDYCDKDGAFNLCQIK